MAAHIIVSLYEKAVAAPNFVADEEFLTQLFLAYNRVGDHVKMQQTAMRLFKVTKHDKYLAWSALNMALQVPGFGPHRLLDLAEQMLGKALATAPKVSTKASECTHDLPQGIC
jgi:hypothetical protein